MHLMFECATRWELFTDKRNPIALVRVKGGSKRRKRPTILTVEEFETIVELLKEPYRTMVQIAQCLGLRVSEIAALQWDDFDFDKNQLLVQRSFVDGRTDEVKTEYSQDYVPLHPSLSEIVQEWGKEAVPTEEGWVFANPITKQPYFPTSIQKRHIRPAGCCLVECPECGAGVGAWCKQDHPTPNGKRLLIHEKARGRRREVCKSRLAHVPPHVPFVAGRDGSADEGAAGTDASCLDPDDDECLWTGDVVIEKRSEWEGRRNGAQTLASERLKRRVFLIGSLWEFVRRKQAS